MRHSYEKEFVPMATAATKQTTTSKTPVSSQAIASDPAYALDMAPNFTPDIDLIVSEGVAAFGVKGAGKSNVCARLIEQISRYPLPYVLFDTKGEYTNLADITHASRFIVATANACPSGQEIISQRLHVIVDLRSWDSDEGAALAMAQILGELFSYASSQDSPADRVPCPAILDEAQYWLPQNAVSYLSKEIARELRDAWHVLATRGRSLGLVPSYFTQNISELNKSVVRQCGLYILMRQVLDNDLDRYAEYVRSSNPGQLKNMIRSFAPGRAIVILPDGSQVKVQFHPRQSQHLSATPTVRGLMARLASTPAPRTGRPRKQQPQPVLSPEVAAIHQALEQDSGLSPMELATRTGCDLDTAKKALVSFFYGPSAPTL
jgi:uncharacterized protein DUF87